MRLRQLSLDTGRRLQALFLAIAGLLAGTLLWMGWQLSQQDLELAAQRLQERRENTADLAAAALQKSLSQAEAQLSQMATLPLPELRAQAARTASIFADDSVAVLRYGGVLEVFPEKRLLFYPDAEAGPDPTASLFAQAEMLEFRKSDYRAAVASLRERAGSGAPSIRASALMRMARIFRKEGHWREALDAYEEMAGLDGAKVETLPAALVARQGRMRVYEERKMIEEARREAVALHRTMETRQWRLSRGVYEFFSSEARRFLEPAPGPAVGRAEVELAATVEGICDHWLSDQERSGRRLFPASGGGRLALWRGWGDARLAVVLGPKWLDSSLREVSARREMALNLTDGEGHILFGEPTGGSPARQSVRLASVTQLPWNVLVMSHSAAAESGLGLRRRLLGTALGIITVLILAGSYLITRAVSRELAVSRLQSDFVSAVSHEFRTPLTSLCLLTGQLAEGKISNAGDQKEYFGVLSRESQRLRRLVEGLLNFGRMEAGAAQYRFETIDPVELVQQVTGEFAREGERHPIDVHSQHDAPLVLADRAALACAVWNLLDNAAKYSDESAPIEIDVGRADDCAAIRVRDHGRGIPPSEQQRIFQKFVRGEEAMQAGIRGTGVGLAMVSHIVAAHKGEIKLESRPGEGSAFTLLLPAVS